MKLLVDTDVIIDFLRGNSIAIKYISDKLDDISLSIMTVAELYAGVRGKKERKELDYFISLFPIENLTCDIAVLAGLYKNEYSKSHNIGLTDALIAATVQINHLTLKTLNLKHYPMIKNIKVPYIK